VARSQAEPGQQSALLSQAVDALVEVLQQSQNALEPCCEQVISAPFEVRQQPL